MDKKPEKKVKSGEEIIFESLKDKACLKQSIFKNIKEWYARFNEILRLYESNLKIKVRDLESPLEIDYKEVGNFESQLTFAGDTLIFAMHTNVFNFSDNHAIYQSDYVKEDQSRAYCGMIQVYNFLADSFRYKRMKDVGYQIARIFINKDNHFFVEGKRQLGFLYQDFDNQIMNDAYIKAIVESSILYTLEFDLLAPPFEETREVTLEGVYRQSGTSPMQTGKRMGYRFHLDDQTTPDIS